MSNEAKSALMASLRRLRRRRSESLRPARVASGSWPVGPSPDYIALLRGEITSEEYVERLKADVDRRIRA